MTADDVRARFEAEFGAGPAAQLTRSGDGYLFTATQWRWEGFKAAYRAAHADRDAEVRELVELAAKAAGLVDDWPAPHYEIQWNGNGLWCSGLGNGALWNPLTDDGDALRLAVKLGITVVQHPHGASANCGEIDCTELFQDRGLPIGVLHEATRLAIVRAAAAIAKGEKV